MGWGIGIAVHAIITFAMFGNLWDERVVGLRVFYSHFAIYTAIIVMLLFMDLAAGGGMWFYWPMTGWGIGIAVHAIITFAMFGSLWDERTIRYAAVGK